MNEWLKRTQCLMSTTVEREQSWIIPLKKENNLPVHMLGNSAYSSCKVNVPAADTRYWAYKCTRCYSKMIKHTLSGMSLGLEKYLIKLPSYLKKYFMILLENWIYSPNTYRKFNLISFPSPLALKYTINNFQFSVGIFLLFFGWFIMILSEEINKNWN